MIEKVCLGGCVSSKPQSQSTSTSKSCPQFHPFTTPIFLRAECEPHRGHCAAVASHFSNLWPISRPSPKSRDKSARCQVARAPSACMIPWSRGDRSKSLSIVKRRCQRSFAVNVREVSRDRAIASRLQGNRGSVRTLLNMQRRHFVLGLSAIETWHGEAPSVLLSRAAGGRAPRTCQRGGI
jgi:hypothetical protein